MPKSCGMLFWRLRLGVLSWCIRTMAANCEFLLLFAQQMNNGLMQMFSLTMQSVVG